jgi:DNA (cytosine-5)-methyltransferase 1
MNKISAKMIPAVYENHPADSRVKDMGEVCSTVTSRWGTGGGNAPMVTQPTDIQEVVGALDTECGGNKLTHQSVKNGHVLAVGVSPDGKDTVGTLMARDYKGIGNQDLEDGRGLVLEPISFHPTQDPITSTDGTTHGLGCGSSGGQASIAVVSPTLTASNDPSRSPQSTEVTNQVAAIHAVSMAVRRLTPTECERLQGFPDNYTNIPWRKAAESPDGPRYKALGNSWAVPVVAWLGQRIKDQLQ